MIQQVHDNYELTVNNIVVKVRIYSTEQEAVPLYSISLTNISETTKVILEKIRQEFIQSESTSLEEFEGDNIQDIQKQFKKRILLLLRKYFPNADAKAIDMLINYMLQQNIGLGNLEILLKDGNLEEIVVNNAKDPVWVFHRTHGWCKTNIVVPAESQIRHYATIIARGTGKEITALNPLMDAHLDSGDRVNATLSPISSQGNTLTIRKFSVKPWTVTDFLKDDVLSYEAAALIWLAVQQELSVLITGGTGSGKTSMLNVVANFFPANQRTISIEDTREITLPKLVHWIPLETRLANPEGKGKVTMLDLATNSLRMRPDRILVGEIRRREEAEVLFEAMRTGHSVCGTLHANNAAETITRLSVTPINLPKESLSALSLIIVQNRNRRTGKRKTLQIAQVSPSGDAEVVMQYNALKDQLDYIKEPTELFRTIGLYTGMNKNEILADLKKKIDILKWLVKKNVDDVNKIGLIMSRIYRNKPYENLCKMVSYPIGKWTLHLFPKLHKELRVAGKQTTALAYANKATTKALLNGGSLAGLSIFILLKAKISIVLLAPIFMMCFFFFLFLEMVKVKSAIAKRRRLIDEEVIFIGRYLLVKLYAGRPLLIALTETAKSKGVTASYIHEIVKTIDTGTPIEKALNDAIKYSPSQKFARILFHLNNALKIGIDVTGPLKEVIDELTKEDELEIKKYGKKLNTMVIFYMVVAIVLPSLGISMFMVLSNFVNIPISLFGLLLISGFIFLIQFIFISLFRGIRPVVNL